MRAEQRVEDYCKKFIEILENEDIPDAVRALKAKHFTLQNDILYLKSKDGELLTVIPK